MASAQFMGTVMEVGVGVKNIVPGDRVVAAFDIACGRCYLCKKVPPMGLPYRNITILLLPVQEIAACRHAAHAWIFYLGLAATGSAAASFAQEELWRHQPHTLHGFWIRGRECRNAATALRCHGEARYLRAGAWRSYIQCERVMSNPAAATVLRFWCCRRPTHAATPPIRMCR